MIIQNFVDGESCPTDNSGAFGRLITIQALGDEADVIGMANDTE